MIFRRKWKENEIHKELLTQIEGLINIDIGNYIYDVGEDLNLKPHIEVGNGIDIYIYDEDFIKLDKYNHAEIEDVDMERKLMIGHYHYEDLLWLIINFKDEKKYMINKIDNYILWKEKYLYETNKK